MDYSAFLKEPIGKNCWCNRRPAHLPTCPVYSKKSACLTFICDRKNFHLERFCPGFSMKDLGNISSGFYRWVDGFWAYWVRHLPIYRREPSEEQPNAIDGRLRMREWSPRHAEVINLHTQEPAMDSPFFFPLFLACYSLCLHSWLLHLLTDRQTQTVEVQWAWIKARH